MEVKIAVISDLHCKSQGTTNIHQTQTFLTTDLDILPANRHPIEALKLLINKEKLVADVIVCPGDISDKMDKGGLFYGWSALNEIKNAFNSTLLFATTGNHDVDSRKLHTNPHPHDIIKQLRVKNYPTHIDTLNEKYWSDNYCIFFEDNKLFLIFNSCYTHVDEKSCTLCTISLEQIERINNDIELLNLNQSVKRVCLLHHHPDHHSNFDLTFRDSDFLENGDKFIEMLNYHQFDLVIHGHKHEPKLRYYNRLPIFASGSFSSIMNIVDIKADNTFHIISLESGSRKGNVQTWAFSPSIGWSKEQSVYFPSLTGFGSSLTPEEIAYKCNDLMNQKSVEYIKYAELNEEIFDLKYLIPIEQKRLSEELKRRYSIDTLKDRFNHPIMLIKQYGN